MTRKTLYWCPLASLLLAMALLQFVPPAVGRPQRAGSCAGRPGGDQAATR